jgi:hypothetical protein
VKNVRYIKVVLSSLGVAVATAAWPQTSPAPTILYGTTISMLPTNEFAVATTVPTPQSPRAQYVVVAEANVDQDLEVLAWQDTTSSLEKLSRHGIAEDQGVVSVAATGLDSNRVVTADVNEEGVLSIQTWAVGTGGVVSQRVYRTVAATASKDVEIATVSSSEVVTAYETTEGSLVVEAWTISESGLTAPMAVVGKLPNVVEASIAVIDSGQVVTGAGDSKQGLWVNTWEIDSDGVKPLDQVETQNAVNTFCYDAPRSQTVAVGAGQSFEPTPPYESVAAAFTPVLTPNCTPQIYYWGVSASGVLTLQSTASPQHSTIDAGVAASMLPRNIPITTISGGTGDNHISIQQYLNSSYATYGDPYDVVNIASTTEGTDFSYLSLFEPYNAYFISAGQFRPDDYYYPNPYGTLFINVLSYPEAPIL